MLPRGRLCVRPARLPSPAGYGRPGPQPPPSSRPPRPSGRDPVTCGHPAPRKGPSIQAAWPARPRVASPPCRSWERALTTADTVARARGQEPQQRGRGGSPRALGCCQNQQSKQLLVRVSDPTTPQKLNRGTKENQGPLLAPLGQVTKHRDKQTSPQAQWGRCLELLQYFT